MLQMKFVASYNLFLCSVFQLDREIPRQHEKGHFFKISSADWENQSHCQHHQQLHLLFFFIALLKPISNGASKEGVSAYRCQSEAERKKVKI